jgi:AraC-like DNA-binding protein
MKRKKESDITNITPDILRDTFRVDNIENHFIIFDDFKDIIFHNGRINDDVCNSPFKSKEVLIAFCTAGRVKAKIGIKEFEVKKQNMFVILPEQIFVITEITPDFKAVIVVLKDSFFDVRNNFSEMMELQQFLLKEQSFFIPDNDMHEFLTLFELIRTKLVAPSRFTSNIIQHYCYILFYNCYSLYKQKEAEQQIINKGQRETVFERFISEVERHFKTQHSVGFYADRLCITPKYLSLLIKETSGKTAADWIREYLVLEARALLKSGRMTVQQVSNELNFADQSHFGNFFKRYTGCSPREYQQK